jgi:hypothetical protein
MAPKRIKNASMRIKHGVKANKNCVNANKKHGVKANKKLRQANKTWRQSE